MTIDVCVCGHLLQAHAEDGPCHAPCECLAFTSEDGPPVDEPMAEAA